MLPLPLGEGWGEGLGTALAAPLIPALLPKGEGSYNRRSRGIMQLRIVVLPGDGVGPEVTEQAVRVLREVANIHGHNFHFAEYVAGGEAIKQTGSPLPAATLDACLAADAVLLGAIGSPGFDHLRPVNSYRALAGSSPLRSEIVDGADILFVRELLGGLYFGEPRGITSQNGSSAAFNTMRYSVGEIERVARVAFAAALKRRRKVTSVDKANVLETSQLWRQTVSRIGTEYPKVELDHLYVDAAAMHLVTNPG